MIRLEVNTKGYIGNIHKTALVYTNDPRMAKFALHVRAFVRVPISVSPSYVNFRGNADKIVNLTVNIKAGLDKPLIIEPVKFNLEGKIRYEIREIKKDRSYSIRFTNIPGNRRNFVGVLILKTNYSEEPFLNIPIRARFKQKKTSRKNIM